MKRFAEFYFFQFQLNITIKASVQIRLAASAKNLPMNNRSLNKKRTTPGIDISKYLAPFLNAQSSTSCPYVAVYFSININIFRKPYDTIADFAVYISYFASGPKIVLNLTLYVYLLRRCINVAFYQAFDI